MLWECICVLWECIFVLWECISSSGSGQAGWTIAWGPRAERVPNHMVDREGGFGFRKGGASPAIAPTLVSIRACPVWRPSGVDLTAAKKESRQPRLTSRGGDSLENSKDRIF